MALMNILYPIDLTGTATSNRIDGEKHALGVDRYRAIALNGGPFFADSVVVIDAKTNRRLTRGKDYECVYYIPTLSKKAAGKEVCGVLLVHNLNVSPNIVVSYNIIGGHYTSNVYAINQAIEALKLDTREIQFKDIFSKPDLWQAAPHVHDIADFYGFEYIISLLTTMNDNIATGNSLEIEALQGSLTELINQLQQQLDAHKTDYNNPNKVSRSQLNVLSVEEVNALIQQVNQEIDNLEPRFSDITKKFKVLTDAVSSINVTLNSLSGRIGDVEGQHATYELRFGDINDRIDTVNDAIHAINNTITQLRQADARLQQLIDDLEQEVVGLKNRDRELAASIQDNADEIGRLQTAMQQHNARITSNEQMLATHAATLESHGGTLQSHQNSIQAMQPWGGRIAECERKLNLPPPTPKVKWGSQRLTGWLNQMDEVVNYALPLGNVMIGMYSHHWNSTEDRQFKFYYRYINVGY